ncbi:LysR family transcriptional regulator [Streptomyces sp. NBRC 110611]|uniref:LysR family transcriptional regulator n=1 Tax=Streptomyces sp. NBRC 110611 TaxID=1621259 RepID=UPI00082AD969|nr:LysR family transcriptional regulator [Streptomyces sp. NBRC 110611]GAU69538.1 LysR family transcriptional regulator [Streptomyces sp. NBRC 110611]
MTLDDLKIFAEVCRARNLSVVARETNRTQSAVSQHVRRLEKEIGLPLVERRPRGVEPTAAGEILHRAISDGLTALGDGLRLLDELRTGRSGTLAIATGATTIRHFMGAAVKEFRRRFPDVRLEFHTERSSERCLNALRGGQVDLAWVTITPSVQGVEQRAVIDLEWVLAMRHDDPLAAETELSADALSRLSGIQLIRPPSSTSSGRQVDLHLGPDRMARQAPTSATDWDTALLLAELGLGHALVPAMPGLSGRPGNELRLVPVTGMSPLRVEWAARQWSALSPLAEQFAATVPG